MVRSGLTTIAPVSYRAASADDAVEVLSLAELGERMDRAGVARRTERPDFHLLLHVEQGRLSHTVDFHDYVVDPGAWLWVRPGQVQRFDRLTHVRGAAVLFEQDYVDRATVADTGLDDPRGRALWPVAGDTAAGLERALLHLTHEFTSPLLTGHTRRAVLQHLLAVLLRLLADPHAQVGTLVDSRDETFEAFRRAVEAQFAEHRDVGHYARALGYSPRTLRRSTIAATGLGAKEFIDQRVVLEAKRLLAHEDDAVAQVASRLGFDDASNFVTYFAHRVGRTPAAFRAAQRG